jgi:hypothetical protein
VLVRMTDGTDASVLAYYAPRGTGYPSGPFDEDYEDGERIQILEYMRADTARPVRRGNRQSTFRFSAAIKHATLGEAQQHYYTWPTGLTREDTLEFVLNNDYAVVYRNAAIVGVSARRRGVRAVWTYSIVAAGQSTLAEALLDVGGNPLVDDEGNPIFTEA